MDAAHDAVENLKNLLRQAIAGPHLPADLIAPHETARGLAMLFAGLGELYPREVLWKHTAEKARRIESETRHQAHHHSSRHDSQANNPITGQISRWPRYAGLLAWGTAEQRPVRSLLLALALAPCVVPRLTAAAPPDDLESGDGDDANCTKTATDVVLRSLRAPDNSILLERLESDLREHLSWGEDGPRAFYRQALPVPDTPARWSEVYGAVNRLIQALPRQRTPALAEPEESERPAPVQTVYTPMEPPPVDEEGLAPEDRGEHFFLEGIVGFLPLDESPCTRRLNSGFGVLCTMPPWQTGVLPTSDGRELSRAILAQFQDQELAGASALGAISILTAVPADIIIDAPIAPSLEGLLSGTLPRSPTLAWENGQLFVFLPDVRPERAHRRQPDAPHLEPHQSGAVVGLPDTLAALVASRLPGLPGTLRAAFPEAHVAWRLSVSEMATRLRLALTPARVRQFVAMEILRQTQSTWIASTAQPDAAMVRIVLAHYAALPAEHLYEAHRAACAALFGDELTPPPLDGRRRELLERWTGSELVPDLDEWARWIDDAFTRVQAQIELPAQTLEAAVECANDFNRLAQHCLRLGTGARPHDGLFNLPQDLCTTLGLAQLAEKQSNQRDTTRLAPLAPVLCDLERERRKMVRWLAERVSEEDPTLAGELLSTLGGHDAYPSAPVLFVLKRQRSAWRALTITGDEECALWPHAFAWARNANRGALVQFLLRRGVREEAIRALLGHSDFAGTMADPNCPIAPKALLDELHPHLAAFLERLRIRSLVWPNEKQAKPGKAIDLVTSPTPRFGDFDAERVHRRVQARVLLHRMHAAYHEVAISRLPAEQILPRLKALLGEAFAHDPKQLALAIARVDHKLSGLSLPQLAKRFRSKASVRRHLVPRIEHPTPYAREEIDAIVRGGRLREATLARVVRDWSEALEKGPQDAQALLLLAAMAAGALLAPDGLKRFCRALPHCHVEGDQAWIEDAADNQTWRWVADDLTASLLVSYHARHGRRAVSEAQVLRAMAAVLERLDGGCEPTGGGPHARLGWLRMKLLAWFRHHMPGTLLSHADLSRPSACLPRSALARRSGQYVPTPVRHARRGAPRVAALDLPSKKQMQAALEQLARNAEAAGQPMGGQELTMLRKEVESLRSLSPAANGKSLPLANEAFIRFIYGLRTQGGRLKEVLARSTISAYLSPIRRVVSLLRGDALLGIEPAEREVTYRQVYLATGTSDRPRRLLALQMFQEMLEDLWGVEPIDWSVVTADAARGSSRIDANLIWPHERERATALLGGGPPETQVEREAAELLLHLMSATGARFGEAFHLRVRDIEHDERFVVIRPNRENKQLKSHAATRRVMLGERLTPRGLALLRQILARVRLRDPSTSDLPLFGDPRSPHHLLDRARVHTLLTQALRLATGDANVRPHHLRHTYATQAYEAWVAPVDMRDHTTRAARSDLFGTALPTRRAVAHWAVTLGHADMETGHLVYLHDQEWRVARAASSLLPRLGRKQMAALWGPAQSAPSTLRSLLRKLAAGQTSLAPWRGLTIGQPPREMPPAPLDDANAHWPDIDQLHRLLTHPAKGRLSSTDFAALFGLPPAIIAALLEGERDVYEESLYFRGRLPANLGSPAPSQFRTCLLTRHPPAGFLDLPGRERINALADTHEHRDRARAVIALWNGRHRRADRAQPEKSLISATHWYLAMGGKRADLVVQVPDDSWKRWCQEHSLFKGIRITTLAPGKASRPRPRLRIVATHLGRPINAAMAYVAQLWLVRAKAFDRYGHANHPTPPPPSEETSDAPRHHRTKHRAQ